MKNISYRTAPKSYLIQVSKETIAKNKSDIGKDGLKDLVYEPKRGP